MINMNRNFSSLKYLIFWVPRIDNDWPARYLREERENGLYFIVFKELNKSSIFLNQERFRGFSK